MSQSIVGIYIRLPAQELARLCEHPELLPKYDHRPALADGRGLDLGRAWEELAVFLDGGVKLPDTGPTVGDLPLPSDDARAAWSYVTPERVRAIAAELREMRRRDFSRHYQVDDNEDTQPNMPGARTAGWGDREQYMFNKLRALAAHYTEAAERGEGMLVRIGERI